MGKFKLQISLISLITLTSLTSYSRGTPELESYFKKHKVNKASIYTFQMLKNQNELVETKFYENQYSPTSSEDGEVLFSHLVIDKKVKPNKVFKDSKKIRIAFIGDTGCRLKESKHKTAYQDCSDEKKWPFASIAKKIEKEKVDFIVHLGDYHYRENCTDKTLCAKYSKSIGYEWTPWKLDFFNPTKKLLKKKPWLFVRGNHEDCDRAFKGFQLLLTPEGDTSSVENIQCEKYYEPQFFQWKDFLFVNIDTSEISDIPFQKQEIEDLWVKRFNKISEEIQKRKSKRVWILTHKPFFGLTQFGPSLVPININLENYFKKSELSNVKNLTIIAGHVHLAQILEKENMPIQYIIGNGGTQLEDFADKIQKSDWKTMGYKNIKTPTTGFGYAIGEITDKSEKIEYRPLGN